MKRRDFLQHGLAVAGAAVGYAAFGPRDLSASPSARTLERIGLELYSVRTEMGRDPERTLAAVARMGYQDVELLWSAGNFGRTPQQVKAALASTGLRAPSAHMSPATILVGWQRSLDLAHFLGHQFLIVPSLTAETSRTLDDWREWADRFNAAGAMARKAGIWLAFHNEPGHMTPLEGKIPYDLFVERSDPNVVRLQLDVGNMVMGGGDPMRYLSRYKDRYWSFHLKDVVVDRSRDTELGKGTVPLAKLLAAVPGIDDKLCFVEQEGASDQLASAARDLAYLRKLSF